MQKLITFNSIKNANTLLNIGPKPDGFIADEQVEIAKGIGNLLKPFDKVIYNARSVIVKETAGIVINSKDGKDYLYINADSDLIKIKLNKNPKNTEWITGTKGKITVIGSIIEVSNAKSPSLLKIDYQ